MNLIKRNRELEYLKNARDTRLIKVITGVRRSGKSTLLELFRAGLLADGVDEQNIIAINFEDLANEELTDYKKLHRHILAHLRKGKNYIFLDEIQKVAGFEKAVDSLYIRDDTDLYITGSNAWFMSSEFATLLTGRYIEIKIYPLSFAEFVSAFPDRSRTDLLFEDYLNFGGFPEVANLLGSNLKGVINDYLAGIYNTIINKDIRARFAIADIALLNNVSRFLLSTVGSLVSPKKIADFLTSSNNRTSYNTVEKYLSALGAGLIFYGVNREDVRGKQMLRTLQKYYCVDTGLRRAILTSERNTDAGHLLENVVYFELLRRRNSVTVGKTADEEVDFIARNIDTNEKVYYQVAYTVKEAATLQRELRPLDRIGDHNEKIMLSTDPHETEINGIRQRNIINWLLVPSGASPPNR
ncbi:MAG: ATP-binding protein [Opitutaceae bacterium]|jgi:predicted AAA+ superfamily ATPase|nr:ATP-binding protein [Opitutaceae bacterium]